MDNFWILWYGHLVYFMDIWYVLWTFGMFYGHLVCSMDIWYVLWTFGMFYGHLVCSMDIWYVLWTFIYILWTFGISNAHLVYFFLFLVYCYKKIWQPWKARVHHYLAARLRLHDRSHAARNKKTLFSQRISKSYEILRSRLGMLYIHRLYL
jgi:hypothetical protein